MSASDRRRAVQYLRMSDPSQRYSLENQAAAISEYADQNGFSIVRSYEDAGISGVTIKRRPSLSSLLSEVAAGGADFEAILVLDVTRWGRYQDADESAHYEFICKQAGVEVHYCAETFGDDRTSPILKQIKRVMAGEYSRELSSKVRRGKRRSVEGGNSQGGACPYGLRRREYRDDGTPGRLLERSQRKSHPTYTVRFEPGDDHEVEIVREIFRRYVGLRHNAGKIAGHLNGVGVVWLDGSPWNADRVANVLFCDLLIGRQTYAKTATLLGHDVVIRPKSEWRYVTVCPPVISPSLYRAAQRRRAALDAKPGLTDDEMLQDLAKVLAIHGRLSVSIVNESPDCAHSATYADRFGGLLNAYAKVGYVPRRLTKGRAPDGSHLCKEQTIQELQRIEREFGFVSVELMEADMRVPAQWALRRTFGSVRKAYEAAGVRWGTPLT